MTITIKLIFIDSAAYHAALLLREQVLRKPLGLELNESDLANEINEYHLAAFDQEKLVGCVSLRPINSSIIKLRQMAVEPTYQRKGIGRQLLDYAEKITLSQGFREIELHARYEAKGFYEKLGYQAHGKFFIEVTIPHILMKKTIHKSK
ncbi:MAG: GNAT family N-acetyltransferase [Gomphosphaeria aponina SAG 52.96 = DSM 107014]|uniref:GNAT family N-acetyltransferase n=1 Tax=Gomphosphaeria aponina SAG 52.96 = DSM 107014 TaxID=1521640 RepID=A0A941JPA0_9CHRO|nr:GNAT family N-acetyltransferase [Gomphosphaeria aponina SAG 52.96 = DSM 107014]